MNRTVFALVLSFCFSTIQAQATINLNRNTKISDNTQVTEDLLKQYKVVIVINTNWDRLTKAQRDKKDPNSTIQTLQFYKSGKLERVFSVSTALEGEVTTTQKIGETISYNEYGEIIVTPVFRKYHARTAKGTYSPNMQFAHYVSPTFKGANMPHVVFFNGGIGTHQAPTKQKELLLGTRQSGGCVRMTPEGSKFIYDEVLATGSNCQDAYYAGFKGIACESYDAIFIVQ